MTISSRIRDTMLPTRATPPPPLPLFISYNNSPPPPTHLKKDNRNRLLVPSDTYTII